MTEDNGWEWMRVEILGRRTHYGRVREEERFGSKMMRIDVPIDGAPAEKGWRTHWYGGTSIYGFSLTDEASVMAANKPYESPYRLRAPAGDSDLIDDDGDGTMDKLDAETGDVGDPEIPFEPRSDEGDEHNA
jgi:hypothetical protein